MKKDRKGLFDVHRVGSNTDEDYVEVSLTDEDSGTRVVSIRMSIEEFGQAVLNLGMRPCVFDLYGSKVGTVRENKTELVPIPDNFGYTRGEKNDKKAKGLLKNFEKDGWKGRIDDVFNHHRHSSKDGKNVQEVTFVRFVPKEDS